MSSLNIPVTLAIFSALCGFFAAAILTNSVLQSPNFDFPGNIASSWSASDFQKPWEKVLVEQIDVYQDMHDSNEEIAKLDSKKQRFAFKIAIATLPISLVVLVVAQVVWVV